jgi:Mycolic acid cyclopropane synthetase
MDFIQKWVSTACEPVSISYRSLRLNTTTVHSLTRVSCHPIFTILTLAPPHRFDWKNPCIFTQTVFPGALLPSVTLLVSSMERATSGRLLPESISNVGPHYPRTLREWRRRFEDNFADTERALRKEHPGVFESEQSLPCSVANGYVRKNPTYAWLSSVPPKQPSDVFFSQIICQSMHFCWRKVMN